LLVDQLLASTQRDPSQPAVSDPLRQLSYANLVRLAEVLGRHIAKTTSCPRVGLMLPSCCAFAGAFYGCLYARRTVVPLNFLLQPAELAQVVGDAQIDLVVAIKHFESLLRSLPVRAVYLEDLPLKREMILQRLRRRTPAPSVHADDVAVIVYTSGTSAVPKGVCLTQGNLSRNAAACVEHARLTGQHRFLGLLPLFHGFGLTGTLLAPISVGASTWYMPRFQPAAVFDTVRQQRTSVMMGIASMYAAMLKVKQARQDDLATIDYAVSGGEALPSTVHSAFAERFGVSLLQGYGLTETSPVVSLNLPWSNRPDSVGLPLPGVTVVAFDQAKQPLPASQTGELWICGHNVMQGYYRKREETHAAITHDGWLKSGDVGTVDAEGYVSIRGRKKEIIIVSGYNVYPREVESVLEQHPAVDQVAVLGQADASRGEVIVAFVIPADGAEVNETALREFCRDRLAGYKVPRRVILRDDLPRGPTGKIQKRALRDLLEPRKAKGPIASPAG